MHMIAKNPDAAHPEPWPCSTSFNLVAAGTYLTAGLLAWCMYKFVSGDTVFLWLIIPLVFVSSHFMHAMLIAFHEAAHGNLRQNKWHNEFDGQLVGMITLTPFTLYRALHQKHHVNLATEKDLELWPFVDPKQPLWWRRAAAFIELNFGFFYTPLLFWRAFLQKPSLVTNKTVRKRIWRETIGMVLFWSIWLDLSRGSMSGIGFLSSTSSPRSSPETCKAGANTSSTSGSAATAPAARRAASSWRRRPDVLLR